MRVLIDYVYTDMDDCVRAGLDMGAEAVRSLERGRTARLAPQSAPR